MSKKRPIDQLKELLDSTTVEGNTTFEDSVGGPCLVLHDLLGVYEVFFIYDPEDGDILDFGIEPKVKE